jgi:hypothetical protein
MLYNQQRLHTLRIAPASRLSVYLNRISTRRPGFSMSLVAWRSTPSVVRYAPDGQRSASARSEQGLVWLGAY